jgi:DNA-binding NtrC family response regulator
MDAAVAPYRRVLIIEDETELRSIIARNLAGRGLVVREADSAAAGVSAVAEEPPDLLVLDINLPDRTGWEVLRELGRQGTQVPTIVMSAVRSCPTRLAEFQPLAYLPKPFPLESLLRIVLEPTPRPRTEAAPRVVTPPREQPPAVQFASARHVRIPARMLSRAPHMLMTATTVVGVLGRDEPNAFRALVWDICDEYGLDAAIALEMGSFSVRFTRRK